MQKLILRPEHPEQYHRMEEIVRDAFWDKYSPGCCEHRVVHDLRGSAAAATELCLAAELDGELVGGIWYAQAKIHRADGSTAPVLTMGPVAVRPDRQGQGIGSALIRRTLKAAEERGRAVVIYGAPDYYRRFGFKPAADFGITDAAGNPCPALLVYAPGEVPAGAFDEGAVYRVVPEAVRDFDRQFPHRQRHLNSRQLFFVPPGLPPEDQLLKASWELRRRAERFLRNSGILEAWESLGAKIRSVGSFRTDLMMKKRDVDLHVYTETTDVAQALKALTPLLASPRTIELTYVNGANTPERCLEWHLKMRDDEGELWTADMIQLPIGSEWDGFFEDTAEAIVDALTPEDRKRILSLKAAAPDGMNICGVEFCKAVMDDHVSDWNDFLFRRQKHPPESLLKWRPRNAVAHPAE